MLPTGRIIAGLVLLLVALSGCQAGGHYRQMLQSPDATARAKGCKIAGEVGDKAVVLLLVDRLEDSDRGVQLYAHQALRRITGKDFNYRQSDPPPQRAQAVARWRQYALSQSGGGAQR